MIVFEVRNEELITALNRKMREVGITQGAIVSLIGAVEEFGLSVVTAGDPRKSEITTYGTPAEMTGTGEVVDGEAHIHVAMGMEGGRTLVGHLTHATISTHFARVYVQPVEPVEP